MDWTKPDYFHLGAEAEPELRERLAKALPERDLTDPQADE